MWLLIGLVIDTDLYGKRKVNGFTEVNVTVSVIVYKLFY